MKRSYHYDELPTAILRTYTFSTQETLVTVVLTFVTFLVVTCTIATPCHMAYLIGTSIAFSELRICADRTTRNIHKSHTIILIQDFTKTTYTSISDTDK